jgi:hypothetical protein
VGLVAAAAERTTAATDAALAVASLVAIAVLRRLTGPSFGRSVWTGALGALGVASALGAITHGLTLAPPTRALLWQPLYLALGVTMALFVVGAVRDWRGERAGRGAMWPMLGLAVAFYAVSRLTGGDFLAFVIYEAAALVFALVVYLRLAARERRPGAGAMTAALALSLAAGGVQAADVGSVRLLWEFDHNGLFHLIQLVGLVFLVIGLRRLLPVAAEAQ